MSKNRYSRIYVLFRLLAMEKLGKTEPSYEVNEKAQEVKKYWKDFLGINSLTDLNDEELKRFERLVLRRIRILRRLKK